MIYIYIYIYIYTHIVSLAARLCRRVAPSARAWVFIKGGCSRKGVQWVGVALYNKAAYNIV